MAARLLLSVPYALARLSVWVALLVIAVLDGLRHRQIRSRGYQLYLGLTIVTLFFVIRNLYFLFIALASSGSGSAASGAYYGYIFFSDVAEAGWIAVLLVISAGYCITRPNLGPHRNVVITIPTIFFFTSLVVDYVLFSVVGQEALSTEDDAPYPGDEDYDPSTDPLNEVSATEGLIFALCAVANSMAFILSWFYMYDTARAEWEALQATPIESTTSSAAVSSYPLPGTTDNKVNRSDSSVGHTAVPNNAVLLEAGQNASHLYGDIHAEDLDAPKNVADRIADREKAKLMRQFFIGVCVYCIAAILVFFLPAFVPVGVDAALVIGYDALLLAFLAVLLFVFRMREGNQYLNLTEEGAIDGPEMTTELGVISHDDYDNTRPAVGGYNSSARGGAAGNNINTQPAVGPRYTLGEEDEEDDDESYEPMDNDNKPQTAAAERSESRASEVEEEVNTSAAKQGVVIKTLPSSD